MLLLEVTERLRRRNFYVSFTQVHHNPPVEVGVHVAEEALMAENQNDKIISQKEKLAAEVLQVAEDALEDIKVSMAEAGVRDLLNIFNSAIKTHRDLMSDIITIQTKETKEEEKLASQYTGKVDELLKRITDSKE